MTIDVEAADHRPKLGEITARAYRTARSEASGETDLTLKTFPAACPYDWDAIMTRPFVLDQTNETL